MSKGVLSSRKGGTDHSMSKGVLSPPLRLLSTPLLIEWSVPPLRLLIAPLVIEFVYPRPFNEQRGNQ
jgi:hypothetical protein